MNPFSPSLSLIEPSKIKSQKNIEIKRKADKISKAHRTFSLVIFWTIIQTAVPKNITAAKRSTMIGRSLALYFMSV